MGTSTSKKGLMKILLRGIPFALGMAAVLLGMAGVSGAQAQQNERCFRETGACISGRIREFWEQNGGLAAFGLPPAPQPQENPGGPGAPPLPARRGRRGGPLAAPDAPLRLAAGSLLLGAYPAFGAQNGAAGAFGPAVGPAAEEPAGARAPPAFPAAGGQAPGRRPPGHHFAPRT